MNPLGVWGDGPIEFGLVNVADSPSLTFVYFPALVLLAVLGVRFAFYAHRNRRRTEMSSQASVWSYLTYVGVLAALYGALGILEIISTVQAPYKRAVMLALVLLLAFAIRGIYVTAGGHGGTSQLERLIRTAFGVFVVGLLVAIALQGPPPVLAGVEGVAAIAFLSYGAAFYHEQTAGTRLRGTMIDSLLRHLLPVLAFAALVNVSELAVAFGIDPNVVPHIQVVFVIMTASTLMTATIKLRQNLASL